MEASITQKIDLEEFYEDVVFEQCIASTDFMDECGQSNCKDFGLPVRLELRSDRKAGKAYSLFFESRRSILEIDKTKFVLMDEGLLKPESERRGMPAVYARIEHFVIESGIDEDLF